MSSVQTRQHECQCLGAALSSLSSHPASWHPSYMHCRWFRALHPVQDPTCGPTSTHQQPNSGREVMQASTIHPAQDWLLRASCVSRDALELLVEATAARAQWQQRPADPTATDHRPHPHQNLLWPGLDCGSGCEPLGFLPLF